MATINILQFPITNKQGGITNYVLTNWRYIDRTRFHFDFATMSKSLDYADSLLEDSSIYYIDHYAEDNHSSFTEQFDRILRDGQYDIVHLHTSFWKSFDLEKSAKKNGVKVIIHAHNTAVRKDSDESYHNAIEIHNKLRDEIDRNLADAFLACSKNAAEFLYGGKVCKADVKIMRNAIELDRFCFDSIVREKQRKCLGYTEDDIVLGCVGRLEWQKNQEFLIELISLLVKKNRYYKLLFVGDGNRDQYYRKLANDNCVCEYVKFIGFRSDVDEIYNAIDIFVQPSRYEGFPITAIEAQANGVFCIESDTITDEICLSDRIIRLPLDSGIWSDYIRKMPEECFQRAHTRDIKLSDYDIKEQIKILEDVYDSVADHGVKKSG